MRNLLSAAMLVACVLPTATAARAPAHTATTANEAESLVREAETFMAAYAKDLAAGNRPAIAARYSRDGAHMLGFGPAKLRSHADLVTRYASSEWQPAKRFAWRDLTYEVLGPDAVLVVGGFEWDDGDGKPAGQFAYTGLLRRENGALRIRVEHENPLPAGPGS